MHSNFVSLQHAIAAADVQQDQSQSTHTQQSLSTHSEHIKTFALSSTTTQSQIKGRSPSKMALLLQRTPCMMRGVVHGSKCLISSQQHRQIRLCAPVQATGGADSLDKKPTHGKAIFAKRLAETHKELTQKLAAEVIDSLLDDIMLTVAEGHTVTIPGFGTFKKRTRAARKGRNPSTGAELNIPEKDAPAFSAGTVFKGVVQAGSWEKFDEMQAQAKAAKAAKAKK